MAKVDSNALSYEETNLIFQQTVDISTGINCAPLLVGLFLYSQEVDLIKGISRKKEASPIF